MSEMSPASKIFGKESFTVKMVFEIMIFNVYQEKTRDILHRLRTPSSLMAGNCKQRYCVFSRLEAGYDVICFKIGVNTAKWVIQLNFFFLLRKN